MAKAMTYHFPPVNSKSPGKAWNAECFKCWGAGTQNVSEYLTHDGTENYTLISGSVSVVHKVSLLTPAADGEPTFQFQRFYMVVRWDGSVREVGKREANRILVRRAQEQERRVRMAAKLPAPPLALVDQGSHAFITGSVLTLEGADGTQVSFSASSALEDKMAVLLEENHVL